MSAPDRDDAIAWAVRTSDPDFDDWEGLEAWLAADPARGPVYVQALATIEEATAGMVAHPPQSEVISLGPAARPAWRRWWPAGGAALAAGIAGLMLVGQPRQASEIRRVDVPAGAPQRIALADGSTIAIAGGSRLILDPAQPRRAMLDRGSAVFVVRHDAAQPFRVMAGGHDIVDVGTAFEVVRRGDVVDVAVAEGAVVVDPSGGAIRLTPGQAVTIRTGATPERHAVAPESIAQWRSDRMSYRDAPLPQVAADLSAALGHPVMLDPALGERRFSGTIVVATVRARPAELAMLLDVGVRGDGDGWTLRPR